MSRGRFRDALATLALLGVLASGCSSSDGADPQPVSTGGTDTTVAAAAGAARLLGAVCAGAATVSDAGTVSDPALDEASGIAASRRNPGIWWVHNDSGDSARFFALTDTGQVVATVDLDGATAVDWEDIAVGPPETDAGQTLYLADIGDNARSRPTITVYRVTEPAVDPSTAGTTAHLAADTLTFTYPDGPHDAEALMVDPRGGDLVIVTKDRSLTGHSQVFRAPADRPAGSTTVLEQVATLDLPTATLVTGADISPDGSVVALRSYAGIALYPRGEGQALWDAFDQEPCAGPPPIETQGEAIGFAADGSSYATISEGAHPSLHLTHPT